MGKIRVGVSGWNYDEWKGGFYPPDLRDGNQLQYVARRFDTIEINGTFYALTDPRTCRRWREAAPRDHRFAVKGSRYITHIKRLKDVRGAVANFFASGILELGSRLGPILWQLPETFRFDGDRLRDFLDILPGDSIEAASLAAEHDDRVEDVSYGDKEKHRIRHVLEFRHESFSQAETGRIAADHGTALCFSHSSEWPYVEEVTAGFVYLRLHGPGELYASEYGDGDLEAWAERIETWHHGGEPPDARRISNRKAPDRKERDVYVYFDNTARGYAPANATRLRELLALDAEA
ncbi:MAG: DUF72 domain-containing protein [Actinomycetota bacterium]